MARPKVKDRVKETTDTTGTGTIELAGAADGFVAFADVLNDGDPTYYLIVDDPDTTTEWELGQGALATGTPNQLSRDRVIASTNSGNKVSWSSGTKTVILTAVSEIYSAIIDTVDSDLVTAGTSTAYTLTTNRPAVGLYEGRFVCFKLDETCGASPTLNVDGEGAVNLVDINGTNIASGALVANGYYWCKYNAATAKWVVFSPFGYLSTAGGTMTGTLTMSGSAAITMGAACVNESEGSAIASASTVNLNTATGNFVHITGTTSITAITLGQGWERTLVFDDALTLTQGASLLLDGANITTAAGDVAVFRGEGGGVTRLVAYKRASGLSSATLNSLQLEISSGQLQLKPTTRLETLEIEGASAAIKVGQVSSPTTSDAFIRGVTGGATKAGLALITASTAARPHIYFDNPNGNVGSITTNGSATAYNTSSDYRLKDLKGEIADAWERTKALSVHRFAWKSDPDGPVVDGFVAHEVQAIVPEAVTGEKDAEIDIGTLTTKRILENVEEPAELSDGATWRKTGEGAPAFGVLTVATKQQNVPCPAELAEGETWEKTGKRPVHQGIDQSKLVPLLAAALKEAMTRIEVLEEKTAAHSS